MTDQRTRADEAITAIGWRLPELLTTGVVLLLAALITWWIATIALIPLGWIVLDPILTRRRDIATRHANIDHRDTSGAEEETRSA